jgi:hypothetical protein
LPLFPNSQNRKKKTSKIQNSSKNTPKTKPTLKMSHQSPPPDLDCKICYCPIEPESYCEYKVHEDDDEWSPASLCYDCIEYLRQGQWEHHLELVKKVDCRRSAIAICRNVPIFVHEKSVFCCKKHPDGNCPNNGQIELLWKYDNDEVIQPVLIGAKLGKDREEYIAELEQYALAFEADKEEELGELTKKDE